MCIKSENYIKYDVQKTLLVKYHARKEKVQIHIKIKVSTYDKSVVSRDCFIRLTNRLLDQLEYV